MLNKITLTTFIQLTLIVTYNPNQLVTAYYNISSTANIDCLSIYIITVSLLMLKIINYLYASLIHPLYIMFFIYSFSFSIIVFEY